MAFLPEYRKFLLQYRNSGGIIPDPEQHTTWLKDPDYAKAFKAVTAELTAFAKAVAKVGAAPEPEPPKRKPGRPRKVPQPAPEPTPPGSPGEPAPELPPAAAPASAKAPDIISPECKVPPVIREEVRPSDHGHTRFYVHEGQELEPETPEPAKAPRPPAEPDWVPTLEVTVKSDQDQRALIDEYGELDRRMQLRAMDTARYETLKRAIKGWFDSAPADADGTVEGEVYLLHLSARERERKIRSIRELVEAVGIDNVLDLAHVAIGALENLIGKERAAKLTSDTRTGSRRIKALLKQPVVQRVNGGTRNDIDGISVRDV